MQLLDEVKAIRNLNKLIQHTGEDISQVIDHALELLYLQVLHGVSYPELVKDYEAKQTRINALADEVTEFSEDKARLQTEINDLETRRGNMKYTISEYEALRQSLNKYGLSVTDPGLLVQTLQSIKELNYDPKQVVAFHKASTTLKQANQNLVAKNKELNVNKTGLQESIKNNKALIKRQKELLKKARKDLKTLGENELLQLRYINNEIEGQVKANKAMASEAYNQLRQSGNNLISLLDDSSAQIHAVFEDFAPLVALHPVYKLLESGEGDIGIVTLYMRILTEKYQKLVQSSHPNLKMENTLKILLSTLEEYATRLWS